MEPNESTPKTKRIKRTSAELIKLCHGYRNSGLSASAFCKKFKLSYSIFQKYRVTQEKVNYEEPSRFIPLVPNKFKAQPKNIPTQPNQFQFVFPNGVKLQVTKVTAELIHNIISVKA